jgi:hypothetical protein
VLLLITTHATTRAQDSKFFRKKLGKAAEVYLHKSGTSVRVDEGQVCNIVISEPSGQRGDFQRLIAVSEELAPAAMRGTLIGRTGNIGNCINDRILDYERVFIMMERECMLRPLDTNPLQEEFMLETANGARSQCEACKN